MKVEIQPEAPGGPILTLEAEYPGSFDFWAETASQARRLAPCIVYVDGNPVFHEQDWPLTGKDT